jgi:transposase-like protein
MTSGHPGNYTTLTDVTLVARAKGQTWRALRLDGRCLRSNQPETVSHRPLRRRERAVLGFRPMRSLQKFASVHASFHNHFNLERILTSRTQFTETRTASLAERRRLCAE